MGINGGPDGIIRRILHLTLRVITQNVMIKIVPYNFAEPFESVETIYNYTNC